MEPVTRGHRKTREGGPDPGVFRPALPGDAQAVMRLYAIAARAVCARPESLAAINHWLAGLAERLVPPESGAAQACHKLWLLFARVAQIPKENLRLEAGKAFCNDLDALGQRLDLPPLDDWKRLPTGINEVDAVQWQSEPLIPEPVTLAAVRERAHDVLRHQTKPLGRFPAAEAARLLAVLGTDQRRELFDKLVGAGHMGRSDVNLLIRFLVKGGEMNAGDTMLIEVLERMGAWLVQPQPEPQLGPSPK